MNSETKLQMRINHKSLKNKYCRQKNIVLKYYNITKKETIRKKSKNQVNSCPNKKQITTKNKKKIVKKK